MHFLIPKLHIPNDAQILNLENYQNQWGNIGHEMGWGAATYYIVWILIGRFTFLHENPPMHAWGDYSPLDDACMHAWGIMYS